MTAEIVELPTAAKARFVGAERESLRLPNPRDLAIEECVEQIARALRHRLTLDERIGLERALDVLVEDVAWHRSEPWG